MKKIVYVCERCGVEWDKEVRFCPMCYTDLITKEEWDKKQTKKKQTEKKQKMNKEFTV